MPGVAENVNLAQMLPSTPLRQRSRWLSGVEATVGGTNDYLPQSRYRDPNQRCRRRNLRHHHKPAL